MEQTEPGSAARGDGRPARTAAGGGAAAIVKIAICWALALFFAAAGVAHFTHTAEFATIVPPALPLPETIVRVTGVMELVFALGLVVPRWRKATGRGLALYLVAVLPANIHMALEAIPLGGRELGPAVLWGRVALQFPLIALVLWSTPRKGFGFVRSGATDSKP